MTLVEDKKTIYKEKYQNAKASVERILEKRLKEYKEKEKAFEKFYSDILKVSSDFELIKTENNITYPIIVDYLPIDELVLKTFDLDIIYTGKLPKNKNKNSIRVDVSEHYIRVRGGWSSRNEGYKVRSFINYEYGEYYKSGRTVAKNILEHVENLFLEEERVKKTHQLNARAYEELTQKFPYTFIRINVNETKNTFTIENPNNTKIFLKYEYNSESDTLSFTPFKFDVPNSLNLVNLVQKLSQV